MACQLTGGYDESTERHMRAFYETLSEKDRRRYAAGEAEKLGHGGHQYIMNLRGCSKMTLTRGRAELDRLAEEGDPAEERQRRQGGGRKRKIEEDPQIEVHLCDVLPFRTGAIPTRASSLPTSPCRNCPIVWARWERPSVRRRSSAGCGRTTSNVARSRR